MKKIKNLYTALIILIIVSACADDRVLDFLNTIAPPSNISASYTITQDNTGLVTITPTADGATSFDVYFGDSTPDPESLPQGQSVEHTYAEGTYDVKIIAYNLNGDTVEHTQQLVVSFQAPQNLVVVIENDAAISKQVNVTANADFATTFDFFPGDATNTPVTGNIGETISYQYQDPGTYTIVVEAKGGAIATTQHTEDFEVTEISAPVASAAIPPTRNDTDVISIFSDVYTNVAGTNTFPDWGQAGQGSAWGPFDVNGDNMLQYTNLSYQGIAFGSPQDVSGMEFVHLDVWTKDVSRIETSLISATNGEKPVWSDLTANEWTSIDIPISAFTDQGLTVADIHQLKFVGDPWAAGTVFIDNIYFYKAPSSVVTSGIQDFEGAAPAFTAFGDASTVVVSNPDQSGLNTTANTAEFVKPSGAQTWAGSFFDISTPLDVVNFNKISVKTWSPKAGATVRFKIENSADNTQFLEVDATTTVTNAWEELTFDITTANQSFTFDRLVIFFDFGVSGDGSTYYYDEINLINDSGAIAPIVFQDFEGAAPTFTAFGDAVTGVITSPDVSGLNTTANVGEFVKPSGAQTWAGSFFDVAAPLDLSAHSKITIKTWSPKAGATVRFKIENSADNTQFLEVDATTSTTNAWEELSFDISSAPAFNYDRIVIFFDFGVEGDGSTYYYDEFTLTN
ncbi:MULTISPECIES: hypothetical protein [Tenacibaculum]|uniref:hypothetical protein n=1 Tax=Tenacibaculum TaxID=104267 RepID=UPI001F0A1AA0|nr:MULTISPECIES: hypothetical protein [Tenacibaculum]MCH3882010.1 hypothetical protein [Tenacibaculum aquimarinum]MDO6601061.1 hypothetical protein [Tenacibaculum sp. 1_MG-2023]